MSLFATFVGETILDSWCSRTLVLPESAAYNLGDASLFTEVLQETPLLEAPSLLDGSTSLDRFEFFESALLATSLFSTAIWNMLFFFFLVSEAWLWQVFRSSSASRLRIGSSVSCLRLKLSWYKLFTAFASLPISGSNEWERSWSFGTGVGLFNFDLKLLPLI